MGKFGTKLRLTNQIIKEIIVKGKRIVVTDSYQVELEDFEIDESSLSPYDVLVKTHASLISPGTELAIYTGIAPGIRTPGAWCEYPFNPGYAGVGEVLVCGDAVRGFEVGDLIYSYMKHASIDRINTQRTCLNVPKNIDIEAVLLGRMAAVSLTALRVSDLEPGDIAAVIGQGLVGNFAAQFFEISGIRAVGIDLKSERLEIAKDCGISYTLNPEEVDLVHEVKSITDGMGVNTTVEAIGKSELISLAMNLTRTYGEIILLGTPRESYQMDVTEILSKVHREWISIKGALEWYLPDKPQKGMKHSLKRNAEWILQLLIKGRLKTNRLISHRIKPEKFESAYEGLLNRKEDYLGVVIDWKNM